MMEPFFRVLWEKVASTLNAAAQVVRAALRVVAFLLRRAVEVLLALIVLFEEWGWRPLAALLASLARWRLLARAEAIIAELPPYLALVAFALPTALFFPLKVLALYFIAKGQAVMATGVFVLAKVFGTALLARIFQLTQPALMRIGWFAAAYNRFVPWKDAAFAAIRQTWAWRYGRIVKARVKRVVVPVWLEAKLRLAAVLENVRRRARALFDQSRS